MIRRDPTLIQMTDSDVQDVRDAGKARTKPAATGRDAMNKPGASIPGFAVQEEMQRKKDAMSKSERLGLA